MRVFFLQLGLAFGLLAGCSGDDPFVAPEELDSVAIRVMGFPLMGQVADTLPLALELKDPSTGKPVRGAHIEFVDDTVAAGFVGPRFDPSAVDTDAEGRASVRAMLGTQAGDQGVIVRVRLRVGAASYRIKFATAAAGPATQLLENVIGSIVPPFSRVLSEGAGHATTTAIFVARDRFGNTFGLSESLSCVTSSAEIAVVSASTTNSCTVSARLRGRTAFEARAGAALFRDTISVIPYDIITTTASVTARLAVFPSAGRTLGILTDGPSHIPVIMPVSPGAGFGSDGTNLQVGGLWISPAGIAWAVGTAGHLGRVQSSASSGNWQDVTLPASMTSWTPRRVYGFGSTLVVLTATNGAQFTLWAQLAGVWTNLAFPDPMTGPPLVAVESATSIYIADPATNRSWHWNGNGWRAIRLDSPTGPSLSLSIVTAALDGTTYGRMASDSATASYRLRDGVATRMPWPHNIADFGGRAIRVGVVANPDALLREVPLHGAYRLVRPINCPQADAGEYADLIGISSGPDGKIWFTAAAVAFANTLTGLCRFVTYTPR